jgi:hypothetical protein
MENLEHNIKNAFAESDAKTTLPQKNAVWNRLEGTMHGQKGVAAFWRVAAVFLMFLLATAVFAGLNYRMKQQQKTDELYAKNADLQHTVDSLLARPSNVKTETKVVEKIIYRDRFVQQNKNGGDSDWQKKYRLLQDSTKNLLAFREQNHKSELEQLENELVSLKTELEAFKQNQQNTNPPFQLKGGRVELDVPKSPAIKGPEMELKVFPKNFSGNSNDLNTTLLKNK